MFAVETMWTRGDSNDFKENSDISCNCFNFHFLKFGTILRNMDRTNEIKFIQQEQATIASMIRLYCRAKHASRKGLCPDCQQLVEYAQQRVENCPFLNEKPVCASCPVHCYQPPYRERVRAVMRYAGPRLIFKDPVAVVRHFRMLLRADSPQIARLRTKMAKK